MELIDRQFVIEEFKDKVCWNLCGQAPHETCFAPCDEMQCIMDAPTVKPKRGEWIDKCGRFFEIGKCSVCGTRWATAGVNYCPTCGSKMRKEDDDG